MPDPIPGDTWNYSGDPSSSVLDEVRFLAQDTDPEFPILLDTEVNYLINKWTDLRGASSYIAAAAAALIARKLTALVNVSADGVDVGLEDLAERYRQVAQDLRNEYVEEMETGDIEDASSLMLLDEYDPTIRPLNFRVGMHDNPEAGRQDYGSNLGYTPLAWEVWPDQGVA